MYKMIELLEYEEEWEGSVNEERFGGDKFSISFLIYMHVLIGVL